MRLMQITAVNGVTNIARITLCCNVKMHRISLYVAMWKLLI